MSRSRKAILAGLCIGFIGLVTGVTPFGIYMEDNYGLHLLFRLRGVRQVPPDVVIVAMESASENRLNLNTSITNWPRALHSRLIDNLVKGNAAVIAFDIFFGEARSQQDDEEFAGAIRRAGNIVLIEKLKKVPVFNPEGKKIGTVEIERSILPHMPLTHSALASAPFALPKIPVKLNSYWTFKSSAGDIPSLPVVVFQIFAMQVYDELADLLKSFDPSVAAKLPVNRDEILADRNIKEFMLMLKNHFDQNSNAAEDMLGKIETLGILRHEPQKRRILRSMIRMYQKPNSRFLNLYGPPGTINTLPYYQLLADDKGSDTAATEIDVSGKAVFVGLSERLRPEQDEGFHTVFSRSSGEDISGVEIAATAFANILEDSPVHPVDFRIQITGVFLWGMVLGFLCTTLSGFVAVGCILILSTLYLFFAYSQFIQFNIWYPVVIPLAIQSPLAFIGTTIWKYIEVNRERRNIRTAFGYQIPNEVVDQLAQSLSSIKTSGKPVYGACLFTDAENYTGLSEIMHPEQLGIFMNDYFEVIFGPVRKNSGIALELKADSMLAIWTNPQPDRNLRNLACHSALEIIQAVDRFNATHKSTQLPTRIGIHCGSISLHFVGAIDHYQYQPVGDPVNTASRIEGLNKFLGTQILVSGEVLEDLDDFLARNMGRFIFAGKSNPVEAYQLLRKMEEATESQKDFCKIFSSALEAFQLQTWNAAIDGFKEALKIHPEDGPSHFYIKWCEEYKRKPPGDSWDGVIRLADK